MEASTAGAVAVWEAGAIVFAGGTGAGNGPDSTPTFLIGLGYAARGFTSVELILGPTVGDIFCGACKVAAILVFNAIYHCETNCDSDYICSICVHGAANNFV